MNRGLIKTVRGSAMQCIVIFLLGIITTSAFGQTILTQTYSSGGTFTVPNGVTSITVECWGAGGAGSSESASGRGGGGGGGAYAKSVLTVVPGASYTITIGTGGTSLPTNATSYTNGGSTSFGTAVVAAGGSSLARNTTAGAAGGLAASSVGDITFSGGAGGTSGGTITGGGGGVAGSAGAGGNANIGTAGIGYGPTGYIGTGGAGHNTSNAAGNIGTVAGGGGSGARSGGAAVNGGAGANGLVIVTYNQPIFYSYQTGSWNDYTTWTTDPGGTTQVGTSIPGDNSKVVILTNRTVSLPANIATKTLDITINDGGVLDLGTWQFTDAAGLKYLGGGGLLRISSAYFPVTVTNGFVLSDGGTTEFYNGANFSLPATQSVYNNLTINTTSYTATQLSDLTLNGDLTVKSGTFMINSNTGTTKLNLTIYGDVSVASGANIKVGQGTTYTNISTNVTGGTAPYTNYYENFHRVVIYGNFYNYGGTVKFTNLTQPLYNAFPPTGNAATSGAASVYFSGSSNTSLICNGVTNFYNLILNKADQSFSLTVNPSQPKNFTILGANTLAYESSGDNANPNLRKALWLRSGTMILKGASTIPSLTEGTAANSDYFIPQKGGLVLDGPDVVVLSTADDYREVNVSYGISAANNAALGITQSQYSSLGLIGLVQVNDGYLSTRESGGITYWGYSSGQLIVNGGIVDAKQLVDAAGSNNGLISYSQNGGVFYLRGRMQHTLQYSIVDDLTNVSINTVRGSVGLYNTQSTFWVNSNSSSGFSMDGGEIRIYDASTTGDAAAFTVASPAANNSVTGGTITLIPTSDAVTPANDATRFLVSTTAPIGNLNIARASGTAGVRLSGNLYVLGNVNLSSGSLDANSKDLYIGKNYTIAGGTTYSGANNTIFNGNSNQTFTINLAAPLSLNKLKVSKTSSTSQLAFAGSQTTVNVADSLTIVKGMLLDNGNTIYASGTIYSTGTHSGSGKLSLVGTAIQNVNGDGNAIFGNVELNNTNAATAPVVLGASATITGNLTFISDKQLSIGSNGLTIAASGSIIGAGTGNKYIVTKGQVGDGGLTIAYTAAKLTNTFFMGAASTGHAAAAYTPATIGFSSVPASIGSITVIPVGYEHPATTTNTQSLSYFWKVKATGFPASPTGVTHSFTYIESDAQATDAAYLPAFYDQSTFSWKVGVTGSVNKTTNVISDWATPTVSSTLLAGDYTAGNTAAFGTPKKYYSRANGLWSSVNTWSTTGHTGAAATAVPGVNDIVIVGNGNTVTLATNNTVANTDVRSCAVLQIQSGATLDIGYNPSSSFGMVLNHPSGNGNFRLTTSYTDGSTFTFPLGDFSDFNQNLGTTELYSTNATAGTTYWLPNGVTSYGNLIISPLGGSNIIFPNNDLLIYGNLVIKGQNPDSWFCPTWSGNYPLAPTTTIAKTITVKGNMDIQGGSFGWYSSASSGRQDVTVYGDVIVSANAGIDVWQSSAGQTFSIGGSLINNTTGVAFSSQSTNHVDFGSVNVIFFGDSNAEIKNTSGTPKTIFSTVTVNKGSSQATTLRCSIGGTLSTTSNDGWLTLLNGSFIYESANNLNITTTSPFTIPTTSALEINTPNTIAIAQGASSANTVYLGGRLTIKNGTVNVGNTANTGNTNSIEYASGGASEINISGGTLTVNGQIRRNPLNTAGVLGYTQSGGTVKLYGNKATGGPNATLEVVNSGSWFNMSAGDIYIYKGGGGTNTFGDLYIRPGSSSVTGGTITIGTNSAQTFAIDANVPLYNLTINGTTSANTVNLMVNPLVLKGNLVLSNATSILKSNNIDVTIKGNLTNNGAAASYVYGTNRTTFSGGAQAIGGTSITNFYNLNINPVTSVTLSGSFTCNNDLSILSGTLICGTNKVTVKGDLVNSGTYTDSNGGLVLSGGTAEHQISGTGTFGNLELNDAQGATLLNSVSLESNLIMTAGILDINRYLLALGLNSDIVANGTAFGTTKMITSDGVFSNVGIQKVFKIGATTFKYPLGSGGKYTPAILTVTANGSVGKIRVNNINDKHPTVYSSSNQNALKYYWEVESSSISGFSGNLMLNYLQSDVAGNDASYIAAKMIIPGNAWSKSTAPSDNVDETLNTITFPFSNVSSISGEYTAGEDPAFPAVVTIYTTTADGNWSDKNIWSPVAPDGGPNGFITVVNHTVTVTDSYTNSYRTEINGKLKISPLTSGNNLGTVTGNGTLYLENGVIPAGRYDTFFDCSGNATLEYGGTGSYTVISDLYSSVPNLAFSGTGTRYYPNKNLTVCKVLNINGPILNNTVYNKKLTILGEMQLNSGGFRAGTGAEAIVVFSGTDKQKISTSTNAFISPNNFNSLEINNAKGLDLLGQLELSGNLYLTNGVINTSVTNTFTITNPSDFCIFPAGGSETSYINGPLTKMVNTGGNDFIFPVGSNRYGYQISLKATFSNSFLWTVQYFDNNPTFQSFNSPLAVVNSDEYWKVSVPNTAKGYVKLGWDPTSGLTPAMTVNGISDMRIADYKSGAWNEVNTTTAGDSNYGTVATTNTYNFTGGSAYNFTTASVTSVRPKAKLSPTGAVCGAAGIPVSIYANGMTLTGQYNITYSLNGTVQPVLSFTSLPITIPTSTSGNYKLVGFSYNSGSSLGVVDSKTEVTANALPTAAAAGPDQSLCGATGATLAANTPAVGTGLWSIVTGTGGTVTSPTLPNSTITGPNGASYTARWTIDNGGCTSFDDVSINFTLKPNAPNAVSPQSFCSGTSVGSIVTTVGSGTTVTWYSTSSGGSALSGTTAIANGSTYYAQADNGCLSDARTPVTTSITPNVSVTPITIVAPAIEPGCKLLSGTNSTSYTSTVSNSTSYTWSVDNTALGTINALTGTVSWVNGQTGTEHITITAVGCGPNATATRTVVVNDLPVPVLQTLAPVCAGQSATVELTQAYASYLWSVTSSGYSLSSTSAAKPVVYTPTNDTLFPVGSSTLESYPDVKVIVTDANGCSASVMNNSTNKNIRVVRIPRTGPPFHIGNSVSQ